METLRYEPPPFPRPVSGFVGREAELARARGLLSREALFLIYGVAGIGKSEFVYKMVEEARSLGALRRAPALALPARAGQRCDHLVSILRTRLGAADAGPGAGFADDLSAVAKALEARPALVFIDDAHNLEPEALGEALGFLARHVARSRIFVASRLELLLPPDTPPPAVCRLKPLGYEAVAAMVAGLGETLGFDPPDPASVFRRSGGSPFYVRRELADTRYVPRRGDDSLVASLRALDPPLRHALLLTRLVRGRLGPAELGGGDALWELSRRFLVDVDRGVVIVHDLVGEALLREASPDDLAAARRDAAGLLLRRAEAAPPARSSELAVDVVEAVRHLAAAGDAAAAWQALERWHRPLARAGLDHIALEFLPALGAALPAQRRAIGLRAAHTLVRHGRVVEARAALDELAAAEPAMAGDAAYLRVEAQVALRLGAPARAAALLERALAEARDADERAQAALALANVRSRLGEGREARRVLLRAAGGRRARDGEARAGRARALSFLTEGRFPEAGAAAARAAARLPEPARAEGAARAQLAALEVVARCACDEVDRAAALVKIVQRHEAATSALPTPARLFCEGLVHYARGHLAEARAALSRAHERLSARGDPLLATAAAHCLGLTLVGLGDDEGAQAAARALAQQTASAGLRCAAPHAALLTARAHLQALRPRDAEVALAPLLAEGGASRPWVRAHAQTLFAHALGLCGAVEAARAALDRAAALVRHEAVEARRRELELAAAEVLLLCGDAVGAWVRAEAAQAYYEARGRRHPQAQAALLRAAALVALAGALSHERAGREPPARRGAGDELDDEYVGGDEGDAAAVVGEAEAQLMLAQELAEQHGYALPWAPLIAAALGRRRGDGRRASGDRGPAGAGAALELPGLALLRRLLDPPPEADAAPHPPRHAAEPGAPGAPERRYDLVVDLRRNVIYAPGAEPQVTGRPLLCALLAHLTSEGGGQSAEHLFYEVWGGREYHPLRHRNTIHVAIMRLRRVLQDVLPGREVVETTPQGWRLAPDVARLVLRDDEGRPSPPPTPPGRGAGAVRQLRERTAS
ncbi:MAG TPA: helix-turn-helix domain-containing protein [Polyangiaceae bacterium]|nr:helix-turn-helix domain-containing protein [Polyangiaceae bacterium]